MANPDLTTEFLGFIIKHLRRETRSDDFDVLVILGALDDVGGPLTWAVALDAVVEDLRHKIANSNSMPASLAIAMNRPTSFFTKSIVKLMSREPFKITWPSVSWTNELPEDAAIAS